MSFVLVRLFAGEEDSNVKKLKVRSSSSSLLRPNCSALLGPRPLLSTFSFMQGRLAGTKKVSMRFPSSRPGFGVKYFGFLHIDPSIFLFRRATLT
ncbi:hypothetical protein M5K25_008011 [Dendrobium thyrsiflorum]|uniref:Uncharacterized protein n=1 Tax=Dendrobium thyrsiflorum TaxID=117978 RepID=A0ABD0V7Q8_DENTH